MFDYGISQVNVIVILVLRSEACLGGYAVKC